VSVVVGRVKATVMSVEDLKFVPERVTEVTSIASLPPQTPVVVSAAALNSTSFLSESQ